MNLKKSIPLFLAMGLLFAPIDAKALEFNPNYIIANKNVNNYSSMGLGDIQRFLENRDGALANHITIDRDGSMRRASDIIYLSAQEYKINPRFLLVMLQKEQSLVEDKDPVQGQLDWAMGYAACDGCDVSDPKINRFRGFAKQVNSSAAQVRYYMENINEFNFRPNESYIISKETVIPTNLATASLYNYTPHIHGNKLFWQIWNKWFASKYPDGTLVQAEGEPAVWLIYQGKKRLIATKSVLNSRFDKSKIVTIEKGDLDAYDLGPIIQFPNFSLLQSPTGGVYLLVGDTIRAISSKETFQKLGFSQDEIVPATWDDLRLYKEGSPININTLHPTGALLQDNKSGGVYYVESGVKHPIWSRELLDVKFGKKKITPVNPEDLKKFPTGEAVVFSDGELLKSKELGHIYVISNGLRRRILSPSAFENLGYKWDNVLTVPQKTIELHPEGDTIN